MSEWAYDAAARLFNGGLIKCLQGEHLVRFVVWVAQMHARKVTSAEHFADSVISLNIDNDHDKLHCVDPLINDILVVMVEFQNVVHCDQQKAISVLALVVFEVHAPKSGVYNIELFHNLLLLAV